MKKRMVARHKNIFVNKWAEWKSKKEGIKKTLWMIGVHEVLWLTSYLHVDLPTTINVNLVECVPKNNLSIWHFLYFPNLRSSSVMIAPSSDPSAKVHPAPRILFISTFKNEFLFISNIIETIKAKMGKITFFIKFLLFHSQWSHRLQQGRSHPQCRIVSIGENTEYRWKKSRIKISKETQKGHNFQEQNSR